MIKRNNKKGFTIVELVIVIAVIAILAAVLIPTFAGIIRKANISADTQLAKNLNNALAADEAIDGKPANFSEVLTVFRENGYIVANLNPTAAGCYFVWESETNQIILVDSKKDYKVIYASKELADETPGETWYFAVSSKEDIAKLESESFGSNIKILYAPKTADELTDALQKVYDEGGKQNLVISADIALTNDNFMLSRADAEIALDLGGNVATLPVGISNTVSADYLTEGGAKTSDFNTLTSKNGVLNISNGTIMPGTNVKYGVAAIEKGTVNISNAKIVLDHTGAALRVLGKDAEINVSDTTLELTEAVGIEVGSGNATFDDVTVSVTANSYELSACVAASRAGTLTVEDGTYAAKGSQAHAVALYTTSGTININGGKFTSENGKVFAIWASAAGVTHTINIKAGTFGSKTFSDFKTVDDWKAIFDGTGASYINENTMKKNADGSWTLTIAY